MKPTRIGSLVSLFIVFGVLTWAVLRLVEDRGGTLPRLSWAGPTGVLALAAIVWLTALALRSRLRSAERRPHPLAMARLAVLGKASAHVGPIIGGFYAGYVVLLLPTLDILDRRSRAGHGTVAVVGAVLLTAGGLYLERLCRIPDDRRRDERYDDDLPSASA